MIIALLLVLALLLPATSQAARLFTCGFEENDLTTVMWTSKSANDSIVGTTPHSGSFRLQQTSTAKTITRSLSAAKTAGTTLFIRFYWQTNNIAVADSRIFSTQSSGGVADGARILKLSTGKIRLTNQPTTTSTDSTLTISANTDYRFELRHLLGETTTGDLELRIYLGDSNTPLETLSILATDTLATTADILSFVWDDSSANASLTYLVDDIAINDTSGSFQTSWPGPGKIALVKPASDTTVTWTKGGSAPAGTNFGGIADVPGTPDDATTLNCDSAACVAALDTNEDKLGLSTIPAEIPSNAVMALIDVYARVNVATAVSGTMALVTWDDGATRTQGPTMTVSSTTWRIVKTDEHQVSDLSAKTKATTQNYSIGYKSLTGTVAKQITAIWAELEWIEAPTTSVPQSGNGFLPAVIR